MDWESHFLYLFKLMFGFLDQSLDQRLCSLSISGWVIGCILWRLHSFIIMLLLLFLNQSDHLCFDHISWWFAGVGLCVVSSRGYLPISEKLQTQLDSIQTYFLILKIKKLKIKIFIFGGVLLWEGPSSKSVRLRVSSAWLHPRQEDTYLSTIACFLH